MRGISGKQFVDHLVDRDQPKIVARQPVPDDRRGCTNTPAASPRVPDQPPAVAGSTVQHGAVSTIAVRSHTTNSSSKRLDAVRIHDSSSPWLMSVTPHALGA